jgi:hypothetical protein
VRILALALLHHSAPCHHLQPLIADIAYADRMITIISALLC